MLRELLIKQYPKDWRDRYGDEMLAVLEDSPMTAFAILDTIRGAVDAHFDVLLRPFRRRTAVHRRRRPSPLLILGIAATLMAYPHVIRGPRRRLSLLPAYTG